MTVEHSNRAGVGRALRDPWLWVVFALALAARLGYLVDLRHTPFFAAPQMDALYHDQWARRLAAGHWLGHEVFFRAPLYPYFLGVLYALAGPDYLLVRVVQFTIGAGTALLTAAFAYPRFGRGVAVAAGLLVALSGPLIYFEGELLLTVLEAPLDLLAVFALDRAIARGSPRRCLGAGAALGLAALVRPTILALVPVAVVWILLRRGRAARRPALLYAASALLVLAPALARNYAVGRDLVPVASQGGLNFYLGNNPTADGMAAVAPGFRRTWTGGIEDARRDAERAAGRPLKPSEVSRYWYGRAFDWIRSRPGDFLALEARKLGYFWDGFEIPNNQDYYYFSRLARIYRVPLLVGFGVLGPLALAGLGLGLLRRRLPFAWVAGPVVLIAVIVAFFVCGRFRASMIPLLAVWAGVGLAEGVTLLRGHRRGTFLLYGALLIAGAWAMNADLWGHRRLHSNSESNLRLGIYFASRGETAQALAYYKTALMFDPTFADGWNNLGVADAQAGRLDDARRAFESALLVAPRHPKALGNLASLAFREGRRAEADSLARRTLEVAGREPDALYNAAVVLGNLGDVPTALDAFRALVDLEPWSPDARMGEARAFAALGRRPEALAVLRGLEAARRPPAYRAFLEQLENP